MLGVCVNVCVGGEGMRSEVGTRRAAVAAGPSRCYRLVAKVPCPSMPAQQSPQYKLLLTWPVMATRGTESSSASARPVTRLVAPGPEVAMHTPTRPVTLA